MNQIAFSQPSLPLQTFPKGPGETGVMLGFGSRELILLPTIKQCRCRGASGAPESTRGVVASRAAQGLLQVRECMCRVQPWDPAMALLCVGSTKCRDSRAGTIAHCRFLLLYLLLC